MRAVEKKITPVWIIQPTTKFVSRSKNNPDLISEAIALTKALPRSKTIGSSIVKIDKVRSSEFFGKGKVAELTDLFKLNRIKLVIINSQISPIQQQNLGKKMEG